MSGLDQHPRIGPKPKPEFNKNSDANDKENRFKDHNIKNDNNNKNIDNNHNN